MDAVGAADAEIVLVPLSLRNDRVECEFESFRTAEGSLPDEALCPSGLGHIFMDKTMQAAVRPEVMRQIKAGER